MKKVSLKKALETLGFTVVQYSNGYNFRSGFMRKNDTKELYYFSYEDLRNIKPTLMIRTADETKVNKEGKFNDYTGGQNIYPNLNQHDIYIEEKRKSFDYNR